MKSESLFLAIGALDDAFLLEAEQPPQKRLPLWRSASLLAACLAVVCLLGYGYLHLPAQAPQNPNVTLSNPSETKASAEELSKSLGFAVQLPTELPLHYQVQAYRALSGKLAEVCYSDGTHVLTYRTARLKEDISGDFRKHPWETALTAGTLSITAKGDGACIYTAIWQAGDRSFSLVSEEGLSQEVLLSVIQSINLEE